MTVEIADQLASALRSRDADRLAALFTDDYDSRQPAHPHRAFRGRDQVRVNWTAIFAGIPDFAADLVGASSDGDTVWTEWAWHGTHASGEPVEMAGVMVLGLRDGLIAWARLYVEDVEDVEDVETGAGIDAAVEHISGGS